MSQNVADFVLSRLRAWGIGRIYGYPGDGINGFLGALSRAEGLHFVQARHEEEAAFMACAHGKFTGELGVCLATSGPGAIHLLNGLYDARLDHTGVLAIVGQPARPGLGARYQQEVDLVSLFKDVAGDYVQQASVPEQAPHLVDQAVRIAMARRTVTCLIFPSDLQTEPAAAPPREHGSTFSGVGYSFPTIVPRDEDLDRAAAVLDAGSKVAMLIGAGARGAAAEVEAVADALGAGVAKALLGKTALSDELPFVTGTIGLLGTEPSWHLMQECDTLLMVGTSFPFAEFLPPPGRARAVQVDIEARNLGLRYPCEVLLHGDAAPTLRALLPRLQRKTGRTWRDDIEQRVAAWQRLIAERAEATAKPINPEYVFHELSARLPGDVILAADSGTAANWYARHLRVRSGMLGSLSGNLASMCPGVPYLLAAKFCFPERPAVAMVGDGAMQMLGINGLITMARYWQTWSDPRAIVLVLNNRDLNLVTWEQRILAGDPRYDASQDVPDFAYEQMAESLGLVGLRMARKEDVAPVWDEAFAARRPVVINALVDPDVPPLPPHITLQQARNFLQSMAKGDSHASGSIVQSAKAMAARLTSKLP